MFKHIWLGAALWILTAAAHAGPLVLTGVPDQNAQRLQQRFAKVADYLQHELNVAVDYMPVESYAGAITAFRNNQVQLAWFGGLSGVRARRLVEGAQAIAWGLEDLEFQTYFIAHLSAGLRPSAEFPKGIRGKTFVFGSEGSTSGRLIPEYHIHKAFGETPKKIFSYVDFSGNHSRTIALVQAGAFQVGAINFKVWERELAEGRVDQSKVRVIWKTPPYSGYQWSVRGDVDDVYGPGFAARLKHALLTMHEKDPELVEQFQRTRFVAADNEDFDPIYADAKSIGLMN